MPAVCPYHSLCERGERCTYSWMGSLDLIWKCPDADSTTSEGALIHRGPLHHLLHVRCHCHALHVKKDAPPEVIIKSSVSCFKSIFERHLQFLMLIRSSTFNLERNTMVKNLKIKVNQQLLGIQHSSLYFVWKAKMLINQPCNVSLEVRGITIPLFTGSGSGITNRLKSDSRSGSRAGIVISLVEVFRLHSGTRLLFRRPCSR